MLQTEALTIKDFSKRYGQYRGVDNVSLQINKGEVFGFLGPNGAGKSTTIRAILDFMTPSEGSIRIFGLDSHQDSVAVKEHIGYLAGDIAIYEKMSGRAILQYLTSLGKKTDWDYVDQLATKLDAHLDRPARTLSKGNRQKIGLIQAFMHKPDLIILDEPTSGLDPLMKQVFYDMVLEMKSQGKTVFVSSHDLTEVQKICDRAAFIRDGKLISVEDIKSAKSLNLRRYIVSFSNKTNLRALKSTQNVIDVAAEGNQATITVKGNVEHFMQALATLRPVDLREQETTLEDMFMHYYEKGEK
jgi:ABC-2 type transport system ATP-binding protein